MCRSTSLVHVVRSAACWTLILVVTSPAGNAAIVTFDDAMPGSPYVVTDVFVSEGVKFEVDPFFSSIGFLSGPGVFVGPTPFGVPPGADPSAHPSNLNLDMDVVGSVGTAVHVSMLFTDNGGSVNMYTNGLQTDVPLLGPDFYSFNGTVINGVNVTVTPLGPPQRGRIDLVGNIDRFVFDGQEAVFDEIVITPLMPDVDGDYNGDDEVDLPDLNMTLFNWGAKHDELPPEWRTNLPAPGTAVGLMQLNDTLFNWGAMAPASGAISAVPEPTG